MFVCMRRHCLGARLNNAAWNNGYLVMVLCLLGALHSIVPVQSYPMDGVTLKSIKN